MDAADHPLYDNRTIQMVADDIVAEALAADAGSRRVLAKGRSPVAGQVVGVRLHLPLAKRGIPVQTVHAGNQSDGYTRGKGLYNGEALTYLKCVRLRNAWFNVGQVAREKIASGAEAKHPMASIDGEFSLDAPEFTGVEISLNPRRVHLFVDGHNRPIQYAEHVTIYGHRAFVHGRLSFHDHSTAPPKVGDTLSAVCL
ncbi:hypothetical protein RY831_04495 [Noviherbaspirillum sp. CPCC 100848]|uniref:Uncharacterized protein n=1 Tax=Noviherbaspirillum album TaxID=3080276 RepID=A0ABU6J4Y1_9BURK|nr:hypothetical protein [Noviherbaspirillum sp. CPCC 100848]MEC4718392.1 hypothetical protein [Noviherbaspirillum sp. CPCC 100848]